jgi:hypothetical protein
MPVDMGMVHKAGGIMLDGLEALLKLQDMSPVIGYRLEMDGDDGAYGLAPAFFLLTGERNASSKRFFVRDGSVEISDGVTQEKPYEGNDYVLYSISGTNRRGEIRTLPCYVLYEQALQAATHSDAVSWKRAKSLLLTMYQQMVVSPDLTLAEADQVFDDVKSRLLLRREKASGTVLMGEDRKESGPGLPILNKVTEALENL